MSESNNGGGCGCIGVAIVVLIVLWAVGFFKTQEKVERLEQQIENAKKE